jgi:ABC-type antimicrobial peptide transport system permease subunit
MSLVVIGLVIGIPLALVSSRLLQSLLFGLSSTDLSSLFAVVSLLGIVAALAGFIPARRASRIDPMTALRYE